MIAPFEVDGVPALFSAAPGPIQAGLVFRVGFADEPLTRSGITHLVEHLALYGLGVADYHYNGTTGDEYTSFHMQGSPDDVVRFVNGVCAALHDLPMHRLPVEKDLLRAEANSRPGGVIDSLQMWRHGARDYGVAGFPELGLAAINEADLRAWVARYFTRDNAALWIAGDHVPPGLGLSLPAGRREPLPVPSSALPATPAYFEGAGRVVGWNTVIRRSAASAVFADVLERAMFRALRQDAGLSYTVLTSHQPIGDGGAVVYAVADAVPEAQSAVLGGFVDVLAAMRVGRVDPAEVATVIRRRCEALRHAEERGDRLASEAANLLVGRPVRQVEDVVAEMAAVTVADVVAVAGAADAAGLLMTPDGTQGEWAGFAAAPVTSDSVVIGTAYSALDDPDAHLVVATDGVSLIDSDRHVTVNFDACAIIRAWPDGLRQFIGHDGVVVVVEPTLFRDGHHAVSTLDAHLPAALRVDQPPRDPEHVPAASATVTAAAAPATPPAAPFGVRDFLMLFIFLSAVVRGGLWVRDEFGDPALMALVSAAVVAVVTFVRLRRRAATV